MNKECEICGNVTNDLIPCRIKGLGFKFICKNCWKKLLEKGIIIYGTACTFRSNLVKVYSSSD